MSRPAHACSRRAVLAALALACAIPAPAAERARRDVSVLDAGRQVASFDLPDGDALCVLAHVTEEDPVRGAWRLSGDVELHVTLGGRRVFSFAARELILQKAAVERLRQRARPAPAAGAGSALPRCAASEAAPPEPPSAADGD
jgi:hypothetical protein